MTKIDELQKWAKDTEPTFEEQMLEDGLTIIQLNDQSMEFRGTFRDRMNGIADVLERMGFPADELQKVRDTVKPRN